MWCDLQRSTLQVPGHHQTGVILLNTLSCSVELAVSGEGVVRVEQGGTALLTPLPRRMYAMVASCPSDCAGRLMKRNSIRIDLRTVSEMVCIDYFQPTSQKEDVLNSTVSFYVCTSELSSGWTNFAESYYYSPLVVDPRENYISTKVFFCIM